MKDLVNNISKGKNLEVNLPKFGQEMMDVYYKYAAVRLSINHYTYNEMLNSRKDEMNTLVKDYNDIVKKGIIGTLIGEELEDAIIKIDNIRSSVIKVMKGLTSLVDILNIYEYVLNRIEYRFETDIDKNFDDDEAFINILMEYMLSGKDKTLVNLRITECVRQLPLRMTKARFFELLKAGMEVYKDSEKTSVDDYIYMLTSSSMIYTDEYCKNISDDVNSIIEELENADYSTLTKEEFVKLKEKLTYAIDLVRTIVDMYLLFIELVGDTYVMLLSAPYANTKCEEKDILVKILAAQSEEECEEAMMALEGKQEYLYGKYSKCEYLIKDIIDNKSDLVESLMLMPLYNSLDKISILESGSHFVEFDKVIEREIAGISYIDLKYNELEVMLKEFFKEHSKQINRAVMAHVLSALPVFFNNVDEIRNYVYSSISGCSDMAEKIACKEIFYAMMEEDGFNVVS